MRIWHLVRARIHGLLHRDAVAGEIREELEFHVRMRTDEYERAGEPARQAARHARRRFGNLAVLVDRGYDVRGGGVMETVLQDVRYAVRLLWKQRGFSIVAVLTLALGVGMSTALFSVIDAAMLHPLPYPHPERLMSVNIDTPQPNGRHFRLGPSLEDRRIMLAAPSAFADLAVWRYIPVSPVTDGPQPERLTGREISDGYLALYGVTPMLGRGIQSEDTRPGAPAVVLLGFDYWRRHFSASHEVVGQTIRFDNGTATIIGVLPASYYHDTPIWRPLQMTADTLSRRGMGTSMVGRLAPDLTLAQAQRQLTDVLGRVPGAPAGQAVVLQSLLEGTTASYQSTVNTLAGAVGLILLIACVNVAGLLLAKGATRLPELAIRASIGAGRGRLIRQLLTESLVLAIAGGAAGIAVAWWTLDALVANIPLSLSTNAPAALNVRVLAASAALSLVTGLIFGLAPALRLSRAGVADALARGSRRGGSPLSRRGGQWLIAIEIALALVLLAGAGLMIRSFTRLLDVDLGFHPEQFMTMEVTPVVLSPASLASYYPALLDTIRQLPGVASAGAINQLPLMGSSTVMIARSDTGAPVSVNVRQVLPGYFEAVGLPLEAGRPPSEADRTEGRQAIVINQAAAKILFSDGAALGREFELGLDKGRSEVIGLVHDVRFNGPLWPAAPEVYRLYRPLSDARPGPLVVVVRPTGDARGLPDQLRRVAAGVGPRVLIERIRNGSDWLDDRIVTPKRRTVLLGLLGGLGLVLTLVGIFGMTAYSVARRTHEIGVRMAFGARPADVVRAMVADAAWPVACGVGVGVGGALFATRVISTFLFETTPTDPQTFVAVAATLAATACIAAWIPARRAARVDPVMALRAD